MLQFHESHVFWCLELHALSPIGFLTDTCNKETSVVDCKYTWKGESDEQYGWPDSPHLYNLLSPLILCTFSRKWSFHLINTVEKKKVKKKVEKKPWCLVFELNCFRLRGIQGLQPLRQCFSFRGKRVKSRRKVLLPPGFLFHRVRLDVSLEREVA